MTDARALPERRKVKQALRSVGLSSRQTDALLRGGWAALVGQAQAESVDLREQFERLQALFAVATQSDRE